MKKKKREISLNFKIERSNELNQFSPKGMSLTEIRFLAIYQAKINARNPNTRLVVFPLEDFCRIMDISQLTVTYIKQVADDIICKPVHLPSEKSKNGFMAIPLFNKCEVYQDEKTSKWLVEIECHEKALPYMFEMKRNYFTYELWNSLKLKSVNQIRMYEVLKQYEKLGSRTIEIDRLKVLIGLEVNQYERFKDFRKYVIEVCQKALEQYTDIKFTFEPIKQGRKIHALKFNITKNPKFKDDLKLKEFINVSDLSDVIEPQNYVEMLDNEEESVDDFVDDVVNNVYLKCQKAYTVEQVQNLLSLAEIISNKPDAYIISTYYSIMVHSTKINNIYKYTLSVIKAELRNSSFNMPNEVLNNNKNKETTYDLDEFMDFVLNTPRDMGGHHFSVFNEDGRLVGYIYEHNFNSIKDGTWKIKYPNCRIEEVSNDGLRLIDLINS